MKILIVEDDFNSRKVLQGMLSIYASCDMAVDGLEGVKAYESAQEEGTPYDVVLLDIMMPILDGTGALKIMRNLDEKHGTRTKIIMTTALDDSEMMKQVRDLGCDGIMHKPINKELLINEILGK